MIKKPSPLILFILCLVLTPVSFDYASAARLRPNFESIEQVEGPAIGIDFQVNTNETTVDAMNFVDDASASIRFQILEAQRLKGDFNLRRFPTRLLIYRTIQAGEPDFDASLAQPQTELIGAFAYTVRKNRLRNRFSLTKLVNPSEEIFVRVFNSNDEPEYLFKFTVTVSGDITGSNTVQIDSPITDERLTQSEADSFFEQVDFSQITSSITKNRFTNNFDANSGRSSRRRGGGGSGRTTSSALISFDPSTDSQTRASLNNIEVRLDDLDGLIIDRVNQRLFIDDFELGQQGPQGETGAIGPQGPTGPQGAQGPQGDPGDPGITVGATDPGSPSDGDVFYNTTDDNLKLRANGVTSEIRVAEIAQFFDNNGNGGAALELAAAAPVPIPWNMEAIEDSIYTHDNVTNNSRVTVSEKGVYRISYDVSSHIISGGARRQLLCRIRLNGTTFSLSGDSYNYLRRVQEPFGTNVANAFVSMDAGDYYEITCQSAIGTNNVRLTDGTAGEARSFTSIELIRRES